jgi:hypothetical protein
MTTKKNNQREAEVKLSIFKAMNLDLPDDLQEALELLRKQPPIVRYIRMAAVFGGMLLEAKEIRPNDESIDKIYRLSVSSTGENLRHYINTGDLIGFNQVIEKYEEQLIVFFDHHASKSK